jgi:hypothetical protein
VQYRFGLPSPERQPVFVQLVRGVLAQQLLYLLVEQLAEQALHPLKRQRSTINVWRCKPQMCVLPVVQQSDSNLGTPPCRAQPSPACDIKRLTGNLPSLPSAVTNTYLFVPQRTQPSCNSL